MREDVARAGSLSHARPGLRGSLGSSKNTLDVALAGMPGILPQRNLERERVHVPYPWIVLRWPPSVKHACTRASTLYRGATQQ
jgi:hypothetical protein